jgi:hypothetical protein
VSDVVDLRPEAVFGAKPFVERTVCGARKGHVTARNKNSHYRWETLDVKDHLAAIVEWWVQSHFCPL